jgi:hypothetical protein
MTTTAVFAIVITATAVYVSSAVSAVLNVAAAFTVTTTIFAISAAIIIVTTAVSIPSAIFTATAAISVSSTSTSDRSMHLVNSVRP